MSATATGGFTSPEMVTAIGTVLSAIAAGAAVFVAWMVYRGQRLLSQRQLIVPLWDYMSKLDNINPSAPITPAVVRAVNTLELIALCVEGGMIDPRVIKRTFRDAFIRIYDQVEACGKLPGMTETGKDLLKQNPAAMAFHDILMTELKHRDQLKGV